MLSFEVRKPGGESEVRKVHRDVIHLGYARVSGKAPHALRFEIGIRPSGRPLLVTEGNFILARS